MTLVTLEFDAEIYQSFFKVFKRQKVVEKKTGTHTVAAHTVAVDACVFPVSNYRG